MGSSEKYSKLRPPKGDRFIFTPGPSKICTSLAWLSRPSAWPTVSSRDTSQEDARAEAVGKQVAGTLLEKSKPSALRRPCGPSVIKMEGTPRRSTGLVVQASWPEQRDAFSSRAICATRAPALARYSWAWAEAASRNRPRIVAFFIMRGIEFIIVSI